VIEEGHLLRQEVLSEHGNSDISAHAEIPENTLRVISPQRLAFEMEFANDCWQADTCYLPAITLQWNQAKDL
jgi:hypothetical protein